MRNAFADAFYQIAKDDPRVFLVAADIGAAAGVNTFREKYPERFLNVGVAEAIMIGVSSEGRWFGLCGEIQICNSFRMVPHYF